MQQFLDGAPVAQAAAYFGYKLLRHVQRKPPSLQATVQDVAGVPLAGPTGRTVLADAGTAPQTQRAEHRRPGRRRPAGQPAHNFRWIFRLAHSVYMTYPTHATQAKPLGKNNGKLQFYGILCLSRQKLASASCRVSDHSLLWLRQPSILPPVLVALQFFYGSSQVTQEAQCSD